MSIPAGAVPKDGPSAGVTLVTSLFSHIRVRSDTSMTGEMTLCGLVLPVGGVKDKVLAAHRYSLKRVILLERNLKDLVEVPATVLGSMEVQGFVFDVQVDLMMEMSIQEVSEKRFADSNGSQCSLKVLRLLNEQCGEERSLYLSDQKQNAHTSSSF